MSLIGLTHLLHTISSLMSYPLAVVESSLMILTAPYGTLTLTVFPNAHMVDNITQDTLVLAQL